MRGSNRLTTTFYRNFILLIVIPLLLVLVVALGILRSMMMSSELEKVDLALENASNVLSGEIRDVSLRLTHFLFSGERQALELASAISAGNSAETYAATLDLRELYEFVVTPQSNNIALHFYLRDGQIISLKDDLAVPLETIRKEDFYIKARENPGQTQLGWMPASFTYKPLLTASDRLALAIAYAPDETVPMVSIVCWYTDTDLNDVLADYNRTHSLGSVYLLDESGQVLIGPREEEALIPPENVWDYAPGHNEITLDGKDVIMVAQDVPDSQWRVVSLVESNSLLDSWFKVSAIVLAASLGIFFLFFLFSVIFLRNLIRPMNALISGMEAVELGNLDTRVEPAGQQEIRTLIDSFNRMIERTRQLLQDNERQQAEKMQAEIKALQSQINPHFLVNSLNSIRFMAVAAKFPGIQSMAEALIKILSASFKTMAGPHSIRDEMELLNSYVYLMGIRYSENFEVDWDVDADCLDCAVPKLIMQPIVENAIIHGFEDIEAPGQLHIVVRREGTDILLQVRDDGKGIPHDLVDKLLSSQPEDADDSGGVGVANVNRRLKLYYGENYGLSIESEPGVGSLFTIRIPARQTEDEM